MALVRLFSAWSEEFLPPGYRYVGETDAVYVAVGQFLTPYSLRPSLDKALKKVLPARFLEVFRIRPREWFGLPDPAAPLRIWNHHLAELHQDDGPLLLATAALREFPQQLHPGATLEQSLKAMLSATLSPTVWRFHRGNGFCLVRAPELLTAPYGTVGAAVVRAAVKALGFKGAQALLTGCGEDFLQAMVATFNGSEPGSFKKPLTHVFGRAAARIEALGPSEEMQQELLVVASWLACGGIPSGFPRDNSSWASLVRGANAAADPFAWLREDAPTDWPPPLPDLSLGKVCFEAIASLEALEKEGTQMEHCVAILHSDCATGQSVVFRVSGTLGNGRPVRATAQFTLLSTERWTLDQIHGKRNLPVPPSLRNAAKAAVAHFNRALEGSAAAA